MVRGTCAFTRFPLTGIAPANELNARGPGVGFESMGPPIHRAHADAHVSMLQTERYVADAQTRWPVVLRQAAWAIAGPAFTLPLPVRVSHVMRSAEAAAADVVAQAMNTPITEPLAR